MSGSPMHSIVTIVMHIISTVGFSVMRYTYPPKMVSSKISISPTTITSVTKNTVNWIVGL